MAKAFSFLVFKPLGSMHLFVLLLVRWFSVSAGGGIYRCLRGGLACLFPFSVFRICAFRGGGEVATFAPFSLAAVYGDGGGLFGKCMPN